MKTLIAILSTLIALSNIHAMEFTCEPDPNSEETFFEEPVTIKLGLGKDSFKSPDGVEQIKLEASKEDRLVWKWEIPIVDLKVDIDARKQQVVVYGEDGEPEMVLPMICKDAIKAEQELNNQIMINQVNIKGKLEAAGYSADIFMDDSGRHIQGKSEILPSDVQRPPKDNAYAQ